MRSRTNVIVLSMESHAGERRSQGLTPEEQKKKEYVSKQQLDVMDANAVHAREEPIENYMLSTVVV